jgi:hypothetical protein
MSQVLDEIVFAPTPMRPLCPDRSANPLNMGCDFTVGTTGMRRFSGPWLVGHTTSAQAGYRWSDLCDRLKCRGLLLDCPSSMLEKVAVSSVPLRVCQVQLDQPLDPVELTSADIVELTCRSVETRQWGWPAEFTNGCTLTDWVQSIRIISHSPVGLGIPATCDRQSLQQALSAQPDFISLHGLESTIAHLIHTLVQIGPLAQEQSGRSLPIIVRTNLSRPNDLVKLICLGASQVTVDAALSDLWPKNSSTGSNLLFSPRSEACPIVQRIDALTGNLSQHMRIYQATQLSQLRNSLRCSTDAACRLTQLPSLFSE